MPDAVTKSDHLPEKVADGEVHKKASRVLKRETPDGLTKKQATFAKHLVAGVNQTEAARLAGYNFPGVTAVSLVRHPAIRERMFRARQRRFELAANLAPRVVAELMLDRTGQTPASVRLQAAQWLAAQAGHTPDKARDASGEVKDIRDMSLAELEQAYAQRVEKIRKVGQGQVTIAPDGAITDAQVIDISAETLATAASAEGDEPDAG